MELLTLKIKPLSAFATLPKGDTIFGQIVAYDFLDKKVSDLCLPDWVYLQI